MICLRMSAASSWSWCMAETTPTIRAESSSVKDSRLWFERGQEVAPE